MMTFVLLVLILVLIGSRLPVLLLHVTLMTLCSVGGLCDAVGRRLAAWCRHLGN